MEKFGEIQVDRKEKDLVGLIIKTYTPWVDHRIVEEDGVLRVVEILGNGELGGYIDLNLEEHCPEGNNFVWISQQRESEIRVLFLDRDLITVSMRTETT